MSGQGQPESTIQRTSGSPHDPWSQGVGNDGRPDNSHLEQTTVWQAPTSSGQSRARGRVSSAKNAQRMQNAGARSDAPRTPQGVERVVTEP